MGKYTLIKTPDKDDQFDTVKVTLESDASGTLDSMLGMYADFLRACGFSFDGTIEIVPSEDARDTEDDE